MKNGPGSRPKSHRPRPAIQTAWAALPTAAKSAAAVFRRANTIRSDPQSPRIHVASGADRASQASLPDSVAPQTRIVANAINPAAAPSQYIDSRGREPRCGGAGRLVRHTAGMMNESGSTMSKKHSARK